VNDLSEIERRLKAQGRSSCGISDARLGDLVKLNAAYEPPSEFAPDLISFSANNEASDTVKAVLLRLTENQLR
jgi:hypothetical protein